MRRLLALLLAVMLPARGAEVPLSALPDLGEASQSVFSPQAERRVGEAIMREIRRDRDYVDDPELADYLNALGWRLVAHSGNHGQAFEFFLVRDDTLNAFALPGGFIGVHTGLILAAQSESELAGVLAHEIAHVTQHHIARMVAQESRNTLTTLGALALAILAARSNGQVAQAAVATAQATAIQTQLDFSRDHEREADRVGLQTLVAAGFDPRGMVSFFERLQRHTRFYENDAPAYLRTHPLTSERIADMESRVAALPYRQVPDSLDFELVRAKVRAQRGSPQEAVAFFEAVIREGKHGSAIAAHYGLARAALRARQLEQARSELATLRKLLPASHPMIELLAGEVLAVTADAATTVAFYREASARFPAHRALFYAYAQALLAQKDSVTALGLLGARLATTPADARLYELEAEAYAQQGKRLSTHRALAEAQVLRGNLPAAIEQLELARNSGDGDFYQLSAVEARLSELKRQDEEARALASRR